MKEINSGEESNEIIIAQNRLNKAYKIIVETKGTKVFDADYKATICYNLACTYQI